MGTSIEDSVMSDEELDTKIKKSLWSALEAFAVFKGKPKSSIEVIENADWGTSYGREIKSEYEDIEVAIRAGEIPSKFDGEYWIKPVDFMWWLQKKKMKISPNLSMTFDEIVDRLIEIEPESYPGCKKMYPIKAGQALLICLLRFGKRFFRFFFLL